MLQYYPSLSAGTVSVMCPVLVHGGGPMSQVTGVYRWCPGTGGEHVTLHRQVEVLFSVGRNG